MYMKEKIKIQDLETRPSEETDLLLLSQDDLGGIGGGFSTSDRVGLVFKRRSWGFLSRRGIPPECLSEGEIPPWCATIL